MRTLADVNAKAVVKSLDDTVEEVEAEKLIKTPVKVKAEAVVDVLTE